MALYLGFQSGYAQTKQPFYRQLAFDFYMSKLYPLDPSDKKIKIYKSSITNGFKFSSFKSIPKCLEDLSNNNTLVSEYDLNDLMDYQLFDLDFNNVDLDKFKVRKNGRGNLPKVFFSDPYISNKGNIYLTIFDYRRWKTINYYIEFDLNGNVLHWCKTGIYRAY